MFSLTDEERKAILFLISIALLGLAVNFATKVNSRVKSVVANEINLAKIDINKVALEDLLYSKCISEKLAKIIIEYRDTKGFFKNLEELKEIKGIGDYRYEKLKELFFVE
jgi:competence ComEA-like helix-hairpin-helix protein